MAWHSRGMVWHDMVEMVWHGTVGDLLGHGMVRDMVWHGMVGIWYGMA